MRLPVLLLVLLLAVSCTAAAQRLPDNVRPDHYRLFISADIGAKTFTGEETVALRLAKPSAEIVLNSLDLEITAVEIGSGHSKQTGHVNYDRSAETAHLTFPKPVKAGTASLHLQFKAPLGDHLRGFYLSKTARRAYAVTQFEGTYARMMFPCFDEPAFKATFDLTTELDAADTAISNGQILSDKPAGPGRHALTFSTSPKMSTYLVALAIGDWQCLSATADRIPLRVCAVPERKQQAQFALDAAAHAVTFYNQWFGIRYPFGKLDLLAIPDYEWGGMENAGSIFFRDSSLLQNDATTSASGRRRRATIVSHEIAHQWFGDYVTAAWWDDIWLNEGFATWMETKPVAAWHPEWHLEDDEASSAQGVISVDSLGATRAIHGDPKTPDEIKEMFDGITYEKGGAVLAMLESYVGADAFRKGATAYLKAHANGNAASSDLWKAVARSSGKPVDKIMPTFVLQPGVPVITVGTSCAANMTRIDVQQSQFFLSPKAAKPGPPAIWQIPVCLKGGACMLVTAPAQSISQSGCSPAVYANRDAKGYYRVAYAPETLRALAQTAETSLTSPERIALIEDTWAMARAGKAPVGQFLDLAKALKAESDRTAVGLLAGHLQYLGGSLVPDAQRTAFRTFLTSQFAPLAADLGWEPKPSDTEEQKVLRASLLGILGNAGDIAAVEAARRMAQSFLNTPSSVDGTLAGTALGVAAANGDAKLYDDFTAAYVRSKDADTAGLYLYSLADFRDPELLRKTIALIDSGRVREQEYPRLFSALLNNPASRDAAWSYLKAHWDRLAQQVTSFGGAGAVVALGNFCSAESRADVAGFFSTRRAPGAERALRQSLESIDNCIEFRQLQQENIAVWLKSAL